MSASDRRLGDLVREVTEGLLEMKPPFQRRLVWTNIDKERLVDTVLRGLPFPEIFVATGTLNRETFKRVNWLVDGQQRMSTLHEYITGSSDIAYKKISRFSALDPIDQVSFLDYQVAVRDLGSVTMPEVKEIFRRINSTDYALRAMEVSNAMYSGAYREFCNRMSTHPFFVSHKIFSKANKKRMYDVSFCVILVTSLLSGYYRRDEKNEEYLERYNDDFAELGSAVRSGLERVFTFVDACGFTAKCRVWKQTDLLTLLVELYNAIIVQNLPLVPELCGPQLSVFYDSVSDMFRDSKTDSGQSEIQTTELLRYMKAATKATNDKYARVERAEIVSSLLRKSLDATVGGPRPIATVAPKKATKRAADKKGG